MPCICVCCSKDAYYTNLRSQVYPETQNMYCYEIQFFHSNFIFYSVPSQTVIAVLGLSWVVNTNLAKLFQLDAIKYTIVEPYVGVCIIIVMSNILLSHKLC